jgi:hypothetical protein
MSSSSEPGHISGSAWPSRRAGSVGGYGAGLRRPSPDRVRTTEVGDGPRGPIPVRRREGRWNISPHGDPEFYTCCVRAGGRPPHSWIDDRGRRVSTLDLVSRNELTLLVSAESRTAWSLAAEELSMSVASLGDCERSVFSHRGCGSLPGRPRCAPGRSHRCRAALRAARSGIVAASTTGRRRIIAGSWRRCERMSAKPVGAVGLHPPPGPATRTQSRCGCTIPMAPTWPCACPPSTPAQPQALMSCRKNWTTRQS